MIQTGIKESSKVMLHYLVNYQSYFVVVTKPEKQKKTDLSHRVLVACNGDSKRNKKSYQTNISAPSLHSPTPIHQIQNKPTFYFLERVDSQPLAQKSGVLSPFLDETGKYIRVVFFNSYYVCESLNK